MIFWSALLDVSACENGHQQLVSLTKQAGACIAFFESDATLTYTQINCMFNVMML